MDYDTASMEQFSPTSDDQAYGGLIILSESWKRHYLFSPDTGLLGN